MLKIDINNLNKISNLNIKKKTFLESIITSEICNEINQALMKNLKIEEETTLAVLITILLQGGGSNKNAETRPL